MPNLHIPAPVIERPEKILPFIYLEPVCVLHGEKRNLKLSEAAMLIAVVENCTGLDASHKRDFDRIKFLIDNPQLN